MNKTLLGVALFPAIVVSTLIIGVIGLSCIGSNPPFAPFGSTIEIVNPPGDINIPENTLTTIRVQALVRDPDGLPLNDVRVVWDLSFASPNDLVIDTDGDGLGDTPALQLIDPDACGDVSCDLLTIEELFEFAPDAFVKSPFTTKTDNRGVSDVVVLILGRVSIEPASLEASLENGSVDGVNFNIEVGGGG
jgi:hypothetical protein